MNIPYIITIVFLLTLGIFFYLGKGSFLIAGYNTMSAEKKARYDVKALCRFMSKLVFAIVFFLLVGILLDVFLGETVSEVATLAFISATIIFALVYANTRKRFLRRE